MSSWLVSPYIRLQLSRAPEWVVSITIAICAFGVYFCMYGFRKPFTAAGFEGMTFMGFSYKVWLVSAQVSGYMMSKFYGIKFISSMQPNLRATMIIVLIFVAWTALLFFALVPAPINILLLFINGVPLGCDLGTCIRIPGRQEDNRIYGSGSVNKLHLFIRCYKKRWKVSHDRFRYQ